MDSRETLALYKQGKEAWNEWAREMLSRRDENDPQWAQAATAFFALHMEDLAREFKAFNVATNQGSANFSGFIFPGRASFAFFSFDHIVYFDGSRFEGPVQFVNIRFPDQATFIGTVFCAGVRFIGTRFEGLTRFDDAMFKQGTHFENAVFNENTMIQNPEVSFSRVRFEKSVKFTKAHFHNRVLFNSTVFNASADFNTSVFEGETTFAGAKFQGQADFRAIRSNSVFLFDDLGSASQDRACGAAEFSTVPDFQQATFVGAPRLDTIKIESRRARNISFAAVKALFKGDLEQEGRWRALKRLATQGHNHVSEQLFFREELLARRGVTDRYWHTSFWFGVFYQLFSDFGRSLTRPLLWWTAGMLVFALIYLSHHLGDGGWWLSECVVGPSNPWAATFGLSLHRSLPVLSGLGDALPNFHACLYGVQSENPFQPIIPYAVSFLGALQALFSAVMIFLFLLAVRNHFRIINARII